MPCCQDRTRALGDALQKCKLAQQRAEQSLAMFAKIQAELKELQRPVGNKVEDVQAMLDSYQVVIVIASRILCSVHLKSI